MCLAVPMKLISIEGDVGRVSTSGVAMDVSLALVEEAKPGDYVIVHAGFAIQTIEEEEALATLAILKRLEQQ